MMRRSVWRLAPSTAIFERTGPSVPDKGQITAAAYHTSEKIPQRAIQHFRSIAHAWEELAARAYDKAAICIGDDRKFNFPEGYDIKMKSDLQNSQLGQVIKTLTQEARQHHVWGMQEKGRMRGVSLVSIKRSSDMYHANIGVSGKSIYLGMWPWQDMAAEAHDRMATQIGDENFHPLNFPGRYTHAEVRRIQERSREALRTELVHEAAQSRRTANAARSHNRARAVAAAWSPGAEEEMMQPALIRQEAEGGVLLNFALLRCMQASDALDSHVGHLMQSDWLREKAERRLLSLCLRLVLDAASDALSRYGAAAHAPYSGIGTTPDGTSWDQATRAPLLWPCWIAIGKPERKPCLARPFEGRLRQAASSETGASRKAMGPTQGGNGTYCGSNPYKAQGSFAKPPSSQVG
ncbi:hypothetical protein WJX84_010386 [Apatococcus fuscideae]|uniref:AP2/ERF domain-containing protein n=1 Tax=Apatococcus fuscideae TaxID=2026836 RepID=A0AAW1T525_9CHLO